MAMSGWYRLGVVLSVLWCFVFSWWLWELERKEDRRLWVASGWEVCIAVADDERKGLRWDDDRNRNRVEREERECREKAVARFRSMVVIKPWWGFLVVSAFSLGLLWLLAWAVIRIGRWIGAGFRQQDGARK
jgi:hypothetical protein